jgi:hypothetical protein
MEICIAGKGKKKVKPGLWDFCAHKYPRSLFQPLHHKSTKIKVQGVVAWSNGLTCVVCPRGQGFKSRHLQKKEQITFFSNHILLGHLPICGHLQLRSSKDFLTTLKIWSSFIKLLKRSGPTRVEVFLLPSSKSWTQTNRQPLKQVKYCNMYHCNHC